jgi:hypothetical protein
MGADDHKVTAFVSVHEGQRLGWKCLRGSRTEHFLDGKYFGLGPLRPLRAECKVERGVFDDWEVAVAWCASFPAHPSEGGARPD